MEACGIARLPCHYFATPSELPMIRRVLIYAALLIGAVIFAWPFIWMAMTSTKLERELFSEHPDRLPEEPVGVARSPYVDARLFANVNGPRQNEALEVIGASLHSGAYVWPNELDRELLVTHTARGIYQHLLSTAPPDFWKKSAPEM